MPVVTDYDSKGRIKYINIEHPYNNTVFKGHSVCGGCGKDMPICWDTVCFKCNKTFCYKCSRLILNYWYCVNCVRGTDG